MNYSAEISRRNPAYFIFMIDQSGSMIENFGGDIKKIKAEGVADAINRILQELIIRCSSGEEIRDYFYISMLGYGGEVVNLLNSDLVSISLLAENPLEVQKRKRKMDDGAGSIVETEINFPIWIKPISDGSTPMCEAFEHTSNLIDNWISSHQSSYPPIIINITDGVSTDGDPEPIAKNILNKKTDDGNVLLFNLHISEINARPILFPDNESILPDDYAKMLFRISSVFPESFRKELIREFGENYSKNFRGFGFNADFSSLVRFLDIGTRISIANQDR